MPMALGHEAAGMVEELGSGVTDLKSGDHVVLVFVPSCGHCLPCAEGRPALVRAGCGRQRRRHAAVWCASAASATASRSIITWAARRSRSTRRCRAARWSRSTAELPFDEAALFGCAVLTGVGAVVNTAQVRAGSTSRSSASAASDSRRCSARWRPARGRSSPSICPTKSSSSRSRSARRTPSTPAPADCVEKVREATRRRRRIRVRDRGLGARARARVQDHAPRRHHGHRRPASAERDVADAGGQPRRRGAHGQGQLHRHLRAVARHSALRRSLSAGQAARGPPDDGHA